MYQQKQLLPVSDTQVSSVDGASLNGLLFDVSSSALFAYADSPVGAALLRKPVIQQQQKQLQRQYQPLTKLNASGFAFDLEPPTYGSGKSRIRDEEKVPCPYCKRVFKREGYLRMHLVSHSEAGREQRCEVCGKGFAQKGHLMLHMRSHRPGRKDSTRRNSYSSTCSSGYGSTSPIEELRNLQARHRRMPISIHRQQQQQPAWMLRNSFTWQPARHSTLEASTSAWQPPQQPLILQQVPAWQAAPQPLQMPQTLIPLNAITWQTVQESVIPQNIPAQQQLSGEMAQVQLGDLVPPMQQPDAPAQYTWTNSENMQMTIPEPVGPQQAVTAVPVPVEDLGIDDLLDLFDLNVPVQPEITTLPKVDEAEDLYDSIDDILVNFIDFLP